MIPNYIHTVAQRFLKYVTIDTQSDAKSTTVPSTNKQKNLSNLLATELQTLGLQDAHADDFGYVYATIPSNVQHKVPTICFCSHVDTTSDCSGENVQPILHTNYQGKEIILPDDPTQILNTTKYPYLLNHIGEDIITASGKTLLGADDKSGVAIIMDLANYLVTNPQIQHGTIKILFTPDEEIGKGADNIDFKKLDADFGYTLDGGDIATYSDATFSANFFTITIHGVSAHPGDAKNKMVNAIKIASEIIAALPKNNLAPEVTEGFEGFVHPLNLNGTAEKATIEFLIRSFVTNDLTEYQNLLQQTTHQVLKNYPEASVDFSVVEQYRNMKEKIDEHPELIQNLLKAYEKCHLSPKNEAIRGGTDGSRMSFMGLPSPNIFTGMQNIHSRTEWIGVKDMKKSVQVLSELVQIWSNQLNNSAN